MHLHVVLEAFDVEDISQYDAPQLVFYFGVDVVFGQGGGYGLGKKSEVRALANKMLLIRPGDANALAGLKRL